MLGEEKGLEATELSFELTTSMIKAHEKWLQRKKQITQVKLEKAIKDK